MLPRVHTDFLYWHAVSKTRIGDFESANTLFKLICAAHPERIDAALGKAYSLMRLGQFDQAAAQVAELRRRMLRPDEMALLGRLHRRCDFERLKHQDRQRALSRRASSPVALPHVMSESAMRNPQPVDRPGRRPGSVSS